MAVPAIHAVGAAAGELGLVAVCLALSTTLLAGRKVVSITRSITDTLATCTLQDRVATENAKSTEGLATYRRAEIQADVRPWKSI